MTAICGWRVPGKGAVISVDTRITSGTEKTTDKAKKWIRHRDFIGAYCGSISVGQAFIRRVRGTRIESWDSLAEVALHKGDPSKDPEVTFMAYMPSRDELALVDSDGAVFVQDRWAVCGSGAHYMMGFLASYESYPTSLAKATEMSRKACHVASMFELSCGARLRTLVYSR